MKRLTKLMVAVIAIVAIASCSKEGLTPNSSTGFLKVRMTDAPFDAQEVNVDIQQVLVHYSDDSSKPVSLNTTTGVYNLLKLQNGVDTLLASGTVPQGTVKWMRLVLGSNNSIKINDSIYPLTIPSGAESGLKINLNKKMATSIDSLLIDFDAALSVIKTGNGEYKLKPVIKLK
jgi:hypothetical protein